MWLERPDLDLDNLTPRQAALDPRVRPELIRMLKWRIRSSDERWRAAGVREDTNWLLAELGADEIVAGAPATMEG